MIPNKILLKKKSTYQAKKLSNKLKFKIFLSNYFYRADGNFKNSFLTAAK